MNVCRCELVRRFGHSRFACRWRLRRGRNRRHFWLLRHRYGSEHCKLKPERECKKNSLFHKHGNAPFLSLVRMQMNGKNITRCQAHRRRWEGWWVQSLTGSNRVSDICFWPACLF